MPSYKEAFFPAHYRAAHVQQIMDAAARARSIAVYGLAGMGKSNIFRFLAAQPQVKTRYLGKAAARFEFVFVDCNLCEARNADALLQELDAQLERCGISLSKNARRARGNTFRQTLRARVEAFDPARVLVILLDPLDETFQTVEASFWAYLRALRDLTGNVVFVLGARRPPPPLRELQELLTEACWVTPLSKQDADDSLARDANRLSAQFSEKTRALLFELAGGHPGLLKNSAEWVSRAQPNLAMRRETLVSKLLASAVVQEVCRDLWTDLAPEASTLQQIAGSASAAKLDARAVEFLQRAGIVKRDARGVTIFSPLFAAYLQAQVPRVARVRVGAHSTVAIESAHAADSFRLSQGLYLLLRALAQQPAHELTLAELSRVLYAGEPRYSAQALAAQLRRLRNTLNEKLRPVLDDAAFNALLPERKHGYRLNLESHNGWSIEYYVTS